LNYEWVNTNKRFATIVYKHYTHTCTQHEIKECAQLSNTSSTITKCMFSPFRFFKKIVVVKEGKERK
jgi:hypothetical protein